MIAFSQFRPDIGYSQGMTHVVGMLLLHCSVPFESFKLFYNIVMTETIYNFYTINLPFIKRLYKVFWRLLKETVP